MSKDRQEWWPEYGCPKCGYRSSVTDVCRKCQRLMFATGFEEKVVVTKINPPKQGQTLAVNDFKVKRREVTKESTFRDRAMMMSHHARLQCEELGEAVPDWAWFGEEKSKGSEYKKDLSGCRHGAKFKKPDADGGLFCYRCWVERHGKADADLHFSHLEREYLPFYVENRRFYGAYLNGKRAAEQGLPRSGCPYKDRRTMYHNSVTFSTAWRKAWLAGYDSPKED
jgi:hypothetical protein